MYPAAFDYHRPTSVEEAIQILQNDSEAKIIAGGHSLLPAMKLRLAAPSALVDIGRLSELKGINSNGGTTIGALETYDNIIDSDHIREVYPALHQAVSIVGTLGGSVAHADPAADATPVLVAYQAEFLTRGPNGERAISADDFFIDIFTTALEPEEVLTAIRLPTPADGTSSAYKKFPHPASGYPVCGVAAVVTRDSSGTITNARLAATGSHLTVTRLTGAENAIIGTQGTAADVDAAAAAATEGEHHEFSSDTYASAEYREHLAHVFAKRTLNAALGNE